MSRLGFNQKTIDAWNAAGQKNINEQGLTWEGILSAINAPTSRGGEYTSGSVDTQKEYVDIPGMGRFKVYYGSKPIVDANGNPQYEPGGRLIQGPTEPIAVAREGGSSGDPDGGLYPDTMVGYAPNKEGKLTPFSSSMVDSAETNGGMLKAVAMVVGGIAASAALGAAGLGSGALGAAESAGTMGAGGVTSGVEGWTQLASGAFAPAPNVAELAGTMGGGNTAVVEPWTELAQGAFTPPTPFEVPTSAPPGTGEPPINPPGTEPPPTSAPPGTGEPPANPPGTEPPPSSAPPGTGQPPANPPPVEPPVSPTVPEWVKKLAPIAQKLITGGTQGTTGTTANKTGSSSGGLGFSQTSNTPGGFAIDAAATPTQQQIANALLLQNPEQPTFKQLATTPLSQMAMALQQQQQQPQEGNYYG